MKTFADYLSTFCLANFLLLLLILSGCQSPAPAGPVSISPNAEQDINFVADWLNAVVAVDEEKIKAGLNPGAILVGPGPKDTSTVKMLIQNWKNNKATQTDQKVGVIVKTSLRISEGESAGDWVLIWGRYTAKEKANGNPVELPYHLVYKMKDGKIEFNRTFYDRLSLFQGMGYTLLPPEKPSTEDAKPPKKGK